MSTVAFEKIEIVDGDSQNSKEIVIYLLHPKKVSQHSLSCIASLLGEAVHNHPMVIVTILYS